MLKIEIKNTIKIKKKTLADILSLLLTRCQTTKITNYKVFYFKKKNKLNYNSIKIVRQYVMFILFKYLV